MNDRLDLTRSEQPEPLGQGENIDEVDPFRPRLVLRFGITGHRPPRLDENDYALIKEQCADVFLTARKALEALYLRNRQVFAPSSPQLRLVSSLAEGADVLAAEAAVENGIILAACLPFEREEYAKDFGPDEWARTNRMIKKAGTVMAFSEMDENRDLAYEIAGQLMLSQSDILIAVWDGEASRGRGGTTEVVAEAVARHLPVIHVDASAKNPPKLLWSGLHEAIPDRQSIEGVERADAKRALPALIEALCAPPDAEGHEALEEFYRGADVQKRRSWAWPLLLGLSGAKPIRKAGFSPPDAQACSAGFRPHIEPFVSNGRFGRMLNEMVSDRFGQADSQAGHFSLRFRSSFVANFAMSGLAVFLALLGLLFPNIKEAAIAAELLVILLIIANTHGAKKLNLHQHWLDRRHLAERLRMLAMSAPLGRLSLRDVENGTTRPGWVSWYSRASARELGLVETDIDQTYLGKVKHAMLALIDDQVSYHRRNARMLHVADHRLHKAGDWLFIGTIAACVAYLAVESVPESPATILGIDTAAAATFVTALFPALAAAFYGIRMQADLAATGERSSTMAQQLERLRHAIERDPLTYETLVERNRRLGEIMLAEVQQWQMQYETKPLSLPG